MSRIRKPLDMQKGNLTQEIQLQKQMEEEAVDVGKEQLSAPPTWLVNTTAHDEYNRLIDLFENLKLIGNLDLNNIVGYCNAYAYYRSATEQLNPDDLLYNHPMPKGGDKLGKHPLIEIQKIYAEEMRKFGGKIGLDVDSRLKLGSSLVEKEKDKVKDDFGEI